MLLFLFLDIGKFRDRPKRVRTIGEKECRFSKILGTSCLSMIVFYNLAKILINFFLYIYKRDLNNNNFFLIR